MTKTKTNSVWEQDLIEIIGETALLKLEAKFGGSYLHVHVEPREDVINAIGESAASKLSTECGGLDVYVPTILWRIKRNQAIEREQNTGRTITELASKYRLHAKHIKKILRERHGYDV
ncbi:Mor transcription activator family protein [Idiomarina sp.]|uniref:Mor transcription activator family protein n=1 Tax=Idiomarina sp. TaxID=1874361 RepID=UPI0025BA2C3D|nr:Mor transcription activator family protein [Idiomarina sp.]